MVISASEEASYGQLKVRFLNDGGSCYESYTSLVDGTLTLEIGGQSHPKYMGPSWATTGCQVPLTVNADGTITLASHSMLEGLANYVATKSADQGGEEGSDENDPLVEMVCGTYSESYSGGWTTPGTLTIKKSDNPALGNLMLSFSSSSNYVYGTISAASPYPKIVINNQNDGAFGPINGTLEFVAEANPKNLYGMNFKLGGMTISYYSANKN
jgi:hypothetical protein